MAAGRLKVFQAQLGFFDTVVATSSRAAALRAWGTHQDLFASGDARLSTDEAAVAAALEHPGALLRRAVGSTDPFQLEPASLPNVPDAPQRPPVKAAGETRRARAPKPPPDRTELEAAELALRSLEEARKSEEADLRQRQDDLDASRRSAQKAYVEAHKTAKAAIARAEELYRKAGGEV